MDLNTGTWNLDDAFRTNYLDTELTGAKTGTYTLTDGSVISNGLELRGIIFYSAGAIDENEPYAADFIDANLNYISTKTSCGLSGFYNGFEEGEKKKLAEAFSIEKSKLKNKSQTISTEILNLLVGTFNIKQINLIAVYAANCVKTPKNATCKLTIGNSGSAMYTNSCSGGCDMSENSFGIDATFCVDSNAIAPKSVKAPMSDSVSK